MLHQRGRSDEKQSSRRTRRKKDSDLQEERVFNLDLRRKEDLI